MSKVMLVNIGVLTNKQKLQWLSMVEIWIKNSPQSQSFLNMPRDRDERAQNLKLLKCRMLEYDDC